MKFLLALCMLSLLLLASCTSPTNNDDKTPSNPVLKLSVEARPSAIRADGTSKMVIFAEFRSDEQAVSDSTQIILLNTLGTLGEGIVYTHGGVALDTLTSDTIAGMGWIVAYSQGIRDSVEIMLTTE